MADSEEVSSSTPLFSEGHHYQAEPEPEPLLDPEPKQDLFSPEDIVDLVGGARDALERHRAEEEEEGGLQVSTVTSTEPEPEPELVQVYEPEPEQVKEPEPQPPVQKPAPEEPEFVAPRAEPESSELDPPAPQSDALLAAAAREAAPSPAEAAAQPAVTQEPVAPASCEYLRPESGSLTGAVNSSCRVPSEPASWVEPGRFLTGFWTFFLPMRENVRTAGR